MNKHKKRSWKNETEVEVSLIILSDGIYSLVVVTKEMLQSITLLTAVDCFELVIF